MSPDKAKQLSVAHFLFGMTGEMIASSESVGRNDPPPQAAQTVLVQQSGSGDRVIEAHNI